MKILISGFKAFNNETINPSLLIAKELKNEYENIQLIELNVEYNNDSIKLVNKIKEINPDIIILLGQACGRRSVCLEQYALNVQSAQIEDNANIKILDKNISNDGDIAYTSTIDLKDVINNVNDTNLIISYHAGTFICNEIYYNALHYLKDNNLNTPCVFIHIPFIKEQIENKINVPYLDKQISKEIIIKVINYLINKKL